MATKKITELPFINTLSGSSVFDNPTQNVVVPVVLKGTTNQITVENFSKFMSLYSATTGSAGNTFVGPQIINNSLTINGNEIVNGNVNITGRLTVNEVVAQYETASILFSTGSTKLGDQITDTHEFTGSTNITGSLNYNGVLLTNIDANTIHKLQQATQSLQVTTASLNEFSASTNAHIVGISDFTSSQLAVNLGNSIYTASVDSHIVGISTYTSSVRDTLARVHQATQSLQVATASLNQFTASQDSRNFVISQYTSSTDAHIVGISDFTSSQLAVNLTISSVTGSLIGITNGLMAFTAALDNTYATDAQLYQLYQATRSLELHSGSMIGVTNGLMAYTASNTTLNTGLRGEVDGIEAYTASLKGQAIVSSSTQVQNYDVFALNSNLYTSTGSLIGITNGLMAFTAALDSTYATDAQLYQLYQATRSIELTTGSLIGITNGLMAFTAGLDSTYATDAQLYQLYQATQSLELLSGSLIGITNGLMAFTAALDSTYATDAQLYQLYQATRSIELTTGSLIGITNGLMAFTAGLDSTYATDAQLYQLYQATQSLELLSGSLIGITNGLMAFTAALDSTYATDAQLYQLYAETASMKAEIAGIEAYTASLKGQAIVSSSTQIQNYDVFALNSNLYESTGSIKAEIAGIEAYTASLKGQAIVSSSTQVQNYDLFALNSNLYESTGSIKAEIAGIEAYTASLKAAAIVSSSQQIQNYFTFAQTSSANTTFYGNVTASGNLQANQLYIGGATTSTGLIGASEAVVQNELGIQFGDATGTYMRMIANTANSNTAIVAGAFSGAEPPLDLIVGGNTQMRLRADGNNGINTTTPVFTGLTGSLTIRKSYNNDIASVPTTTGQNYYSNQSGLYLFGRNSGITIVGGNSEEATICYGNQSTHRFASISAGTGTDAVGGDLYIKVGSDTERLRIGSTGDGNVTVSTGNLVMGTSGKGIDFSATSNGSGTTSSELLNDYEEGTWTIGLTFGGNSVGLTFSSNTGTYTKIGNQVTVTGFGALSNKGTSTGDAKITGLPFTIPNFDKNYSAVNLRFDNITFTGQFQGYGVIGTTTINLEEITEAGVRGGISNSDFTNSSAFLFSFTYTV